MEPEQPRTAMTCGPPTAVLGEAMAVIGGPSLDDSAWNTLEQKNNCSWELKRCDSAWNLLTSCR